MSQLIKPIQRLPDRPSWLIRAALIDLNECSRHPLYSVARDPDVLQKSPTAWLRYTSAPRAEDYFWNHAWHERREGKCHVCFAGAVMARSCLVSPFESHIPDDFDDDTRKKLMALNELRQGDIYTALVHILGYEQCPLEVERKITPYAENRQSFYYEMRQLANDLEKHDL